MKQMSWLGLIGLGGLLVGCASPPVISGDVPTGSSAVKPPPLPGSSAGITVTPSTSPADFQKLVATNAPRWGVGRKDPFALTLAELDFDHAQDSERVFTSNGGFYSGLEIKQEEVVAPRIEPQPYRRLSGVVVGDSVLAIIDMGDGRPPRIVRPGMKIPDSEWTVISIDQDKAVLRRSGNVLPKEVEVRLESPPFGTTTGLGGGNPAAGGPPLGGRGGRGGPGMGGPGGRGGGFGGGKGE